MTHKESVQASDTESSSKGDTESQASGDSDDEMGGDSDSKDEGSGCCGVVQVVRMKDQVVMGKVQAARVEQGTMALNKCVKPNPKTTLPKLDSKDRGEAQDKMSWFCMPLRHELQCMLR